MNCLQSCRHWEKRVQGLWVIDWTLFVVNRRGLDITLLAEPSSDEDVDEAAMKRKKRKSERRRQRRSATSAVTRDEESALDIKPTAAAAAVSVAKSSGDVTSHTAATESKMASAVRTRKRLQSLCRFSHLLFWVIFLSYYCSKCVALVCAKEAGVAGFDLWASAVRKNHCSQVQCFDAQSDSFKKWLFISAVIQMFYSLCLPQLQLILWTKSFRIFRV